MGEPGMSAGAYPAPNEFRRDLAYSQRMGDAEFWDKIYRKAFPNLVNHMSCDGDFASQRMGIDRIIMLGNGQTLKIDEKKRRQDYSDILLEFVSNDATGAPGWMEKDLAIDYLAYAFMQSKRCYLFPWPLLRRAWLHLGQGWRDTYPIKVAQNPGYKTLSVAVPIQVVRQSVSLAALIEL